MLSFASIPKQCPLNPPPCWHVLMFPNGTGGSGRCAWLCLCHAKTAVACCTRRKRTVCALPFLVLPLSPVLARHPEGQLPWPRKTETAWAPKFPWCPPPLPQCLPLSIGQPHPGQTTEMSKLNREVKCHRANRHKGQPPTSRSPKPAWTSGFPA